jgi:acetylornithine deacetylase/succinyl-diaminopimelate desuccinylase-like protein
MADMENLEKLVAEIDRFREIIITNIVLIGQIPAPTFREKRRAETVLERMEELGTDECKADEFGNPVGVIRGTSTIKTPIMLAAHLDTVFDEDVSHNFNVSGNTITGAGILDNSAGVGVLVSMPEIIRRLDLTFESDIVLAGVVESIGAGNLGGVRALLDNLKRPVRGAICLESGGLGRLNYYSHGMIRAEIECRAAAEEGLERNFQPNAIIVLNEIINEIMAIRLPQRPQSRVVIGKISGGVKHGLAPSDAGLGLEIQSGSDAMVREIFDNIEDIVNEIGQQYSVDLNLSTISSQKAARLKYSHPLIKSTAKIMAGLGIKPSGMSSSSELSVFLSRDIPAVTLGVTNGYHYQKENATIEIDPIARGIAQVVGVLQAIDKGVCDEK